MSFLAIFFHFEAIEKEGSLRFSWSIGYHQPIVRVSIVLHEGLVGELYYLLWWKKQFSSTSRGIEDHHHFPNYVKFVPNLFCWKKPNSTTKTQQVTDPEANGSDPDPELGSAKEDLLCKGYGEEGVESELMRLHNLCGPPRFLFTISEETKEDLESDDGRSRKGSRTRSLSDCLLVETPILNSSGLTHN
ncbi:hypothetical protein Acr_26g0012730 [Actinidia rufa]|uniref:Uncharacterized protein n=1 Tax=Actinidia rufa TaxID=165716 RepID=A0A7J0H5G4_9ERIC|nr:hypothetical protein Acr_26g0012730 [Actinidia rufa]